MTRVLIGCDTLGNGGAQRQLTLLARSLPDGYEARVFSLDDGPYADVLRASGVELQVARRRSRYDISAIFHLSREINVWQPDVVHSWGWMSSAASIVTCKLRGIPLIDGTIRRGRPPERWARVNRFLISRADAVIANSEAGAASYGELKPRVFVVHNGFDDARVPPEADMPTRAQGAIVEAVMAARMAPEKDFDTLIDAVETMRQAQRPIRFTLMGSGTDRERLITRCAELIEAGTVRIMDGGLEVMPVLAAADIGVLLTDPRYHAEGLSNSIMEYMACGLPVVCTDSGGNREVVSDGDTGLLVPPRDSGAVVDALCRLLDDPVEARRFGEAGRERIRTEFSTQGMVANTVAVYESVIGRGSGPA